MLCINLTSVRDNKPIVLNQKLTASRFYIGSSDVPSFPNRLVFTVPTEAQEQMYEQLRQLDVEWLMDELNRLGRGPVFIVVPFALRVQEEAYTSFREREGQSAIRNALNLNLGDPSIFIRGVSVPTICISCEKQEQLKGRRCLDYVEGSFSCFKTSRFALTAMDTFYLTEKGELVYNATSISDAPGEQVESNPSTAPANT